MAFVTIETVAKRSAAEKEPKFGSTNGTILTLLCPICRKDEAPLMVGTSMEIVPSVAAALPEIVMAFPACERVMFDPPTSVRVPEETRAVAPAVLPEILRSNTFWVWTD